MFDTKSLSVGWGINEDVLLVGDHEALNSRIICRNDENRMDKVRLLSSIQMDITLLKASNYTQALKWP